MKTSILNFASTRVFSLRLITSNYIKIVEGTTICTEGIATNITPVYVALFQDGDLAEIFFRL